MHVRFVNCLAASAAALLALPTLAAAQLLNCGGVTLTHSMRQTPNFKLSVDVSATTTRPVINCPLELQTEAWVDAVFPPYVGVNRQLYAAAVSLTRPVPSFGIWHSSAKHWLIWMGVNSWNNLGTTYAQVAVQAPPPKPGDVCLLNEGDCPDGYQFESWRCDCVTLSPIVIDTAGDGYRLTSPDEGVTFDLDANGRVVEKIAWTEANSDDGWLVLDRNGNGTIDSGAELFGSRTPAHANADGLIAQNGFEALLFTEGPDYGGGRADRVIDANDAVFGRLRVWFDRNHNGLSEPEELVTLPNAGIVALKTSYRRDERRDRYGNRFALRGTAIVRGPGGQQVERTIYDVFLKVAGPPAP